MKEIEHHGTVAMTDTPSPQDHSRGRPAGHCDDDKAWQQFSADYAHHPRANLGKGNMTDFALANAQFMCDRNSLDLIVYQTAVKERIRWLSIQLAAALAAKTPSPDCIEDAAKHVFNAMRVAAKEAGVNAPAWTDRGNSTMQEEARSAAYRILNTPSSAPNVLVSPDQERMIRDIVRAAYDRGYNDARNVRAVPGDNAPGYRGRDIEAERSDELLARFKRLAAILSPPAPAGNVLVSPDQERMIRDIVRAAYDRGYNDARNVRAVPGDNAPGYRGRDIEAERSDELLARFKRLAAILSPPAPAGNVLVSPDQERMIRDIVRAAYDRGYNDARNVRAVPGDNAPGYRGRDIEAERSDELLARFKRLAAILSPPAPAGNLAGSGLFATAMQALEKIAALRDSEGAEPFDEALDIADAAITANAASFSAAVTAALAAAATAPAMSLSMHHPLCSVQKGGSCDYDCPRDYTPPAQRAASDE